MQFSLFNGVLKLFLLDEMIRQITLVNIQRGELLIRIRDEFNSTIEAYKQISEDCLLFNIRKTKAVNNFIYNTIHVINPIFLSLDFI